MRRLSDFKSRPPQALRRPAVLVFTNPSMERPLHGLCDRPAVIRKLEGRQLRLDPRHYRLIDQDGALQTSQSHH